MEIKPGQWIFTLAWQGPVLLVTKASLKRVTCDCHGRLAFLSRDDVIAVGDTKEDAKRAAAAYSDHVSSRSDELNAAAETSLRARETHYVLHCAIKSDAAEAARAAIAKAEGRS